MGNLLENLGGHLPGDRPAISKALVSADVSIGPDTFLAIRFLSAIAGALIGLRFGTLAIVVAPASGWAFYQLPEWVLNGRLRARRDEIARALPDAVDLLSVCTEAGLNIPLSLQRVAGRTAGALGTELTRYIGEVELGVPRSTALSNLVQRCDVQEVESMVATLSRSDRFGTQVSAALKDFSTDLRASRRRKVEEQARRAPVKILFPLVFLILPAFVLLTVVPLLLGTFQTLGF